MNQIQNAGVVKFHQDFLDLVGAWITAVYDDSSVPYINCDLKCNERPMAYSKGKEFDLTKYIETDGTITLNLDADSIRSGSLMFFTPEPATEATGVFSGAQVAFDLRFSGVITSVYVPVMSIRRLINKSRERIDIVLPRFDLTSGDIFQFMVNPETKYPDLLSHMDKMMGNLTVIKPVELYPNMGVVGDRVYRRFMDVSDLQEVLHQFVGLVTERGFIPIFKLRDIVTEEILFVPINEMMVHIRGHDDGSKTIECSFDGRLLSWGEVPGTPYRYTDESCKTRECAILNVFAEPNSDGAVPFFVNEEGRIMMVEDQVHSTVFSAPSDSVTMGSEEPVMVGGVADNSNVVSFAKYQKK